MSDAKNPPIDEFRGFIQSSGENPVGSNPAVGCFGHTRGVKIPPPALPAFLAYALGFATNSISIAKIRENRFYLCCNLLEFCLGDHPNFLHRYCDECSIPFQCYMTAFWSNFDETELITENHDEFPALNGTKISLGCDRP